MRGSIRATSEKVLETIGRRPFLRLVHQVLIWDRLEAAVFRRIKRAEVSGLTGSIGLGRLRLARASGWPAASTSTFVFVQLTVRAAGV